MRTKSRVERDARRYQKKRAAMSKKELDAERAAKAEYMRQYRANKVRSYSQIERANVDIKFPKFK